MEYLSTKQIDSFIDNGFVKIDRAFPTDVAGQCRAILWKATGCDPENPDSWTQPVIRIGELGAEPFKIAANTPILHHAFDQLIGKGNWLPRETLGSFPIRFPNKQPAADTGWHVDASFPGDNPDNYLEWRININSKGRALLTLFLFSDVSESDAPTVIKMGSHFDVAKILEPEGESGLPFMALAKKLEGIPAHEETLATGPAGTVYLCPPFIVHAGQNHYGHIPKFMAQPPLLRKREVDLTQKNQEHFPVELAILKGLAI
jgi:hypothetical protein